jgi:hypothetical protein
LQGVLAGDWTVERPLAVVVLTIRVCLIHREEQSIPTGISPEAKGEIHAGNWAWTVFECVVFVHDISVRSHWPADCHTLAVILPGYRILAVPNATPAYATKLVPECPYKQTYIS